MLKILMIDDIKQPEWFKYDFEENGKPFFFDDENTTIARTGEEGVQLLNAWKWDVLLLDHDLGPGMDGRDVLKKVKELGPLIPDQIILITNNIITGPRMMDTLKEWKAEGLIKSYDWIRA